MAWYLPHKDEEHSLSNGATRILNLRGDARDFSTQLDLLSEISTRVFVTIDEKVKPDDNMVNMPQKIKWPVILLWSKKDTDGQSEEDGEKSENLRKMIDKLYKEIFECYHDNEFEMRKESIDAIQESLHGYAKCLSHEKIVYLARERFGSLISIDEDTEYCKDGNKAAENYKAQSCGVN